jgi:predicted Ser/Thr protein kinase
MTTPVGFKKTNYTVEALGSNFPLYKKVQTGTYYYINPSGIKHQVPQHTDVKNKGGTKKKLGLFLKAAKKAASTLAPVAKKSPTPVAKKSPTPVASIYKPAPFEFAGMPVYLSKQNYSLYYQRPANGQMMHLKKDSPFTLKNKKGNTHVIKNFYNKVYFRTNKLIPEKGSFVYYNPYLQNVGVHKNKKQLFSTSKEKLNSFPNKNKVLSNLQKTLPPNMSPSNITKSPPVPGWTKTNYMSTNNNPIYKKNSSGRYYVFYKNTKQPKMQISLKDKVKNKNGNEVVLGDIFKPKAAPKAASPPVQVVTVSVVPVIKPTDDHIRAKSSYFSARVLKAGERFRKIRNELLEEKNTSNIKNNYCKAGGNMGIVYGNRTNELKYKYTSVKGFENGTNWVSSLSAPMFQHRIYTFEMTYSEYHFVEELLGRYGRNVNSYANVNPRMIMDPHWFAAQDKYIRSLTPYKLFTLYGYTNNGDKWAHAYLEGNFDYTKFHDSIKNKGIVDPYFALFFQARDYYKINTGDVRKDYQEVITRMNKEYNSNITEFKKQVNSIICMFINDLNEIIKDSPPTTTSFVLFRGQKDDRYTKNAATLSGVVGEVYTSERFCSSSISGDLAYSFSGGHTLQRITILKGSKCMLMFGVTWYDNEYEILLPRGATYQIFSRRRNVSFSTSHATNVCKGPAYKRTVQNLVDIVLLGTVEPPPPTALVPVTVDPNSNSHVMQKYIKNSNLKITGLVGKGGYGAVFQGTKKNVGNVAVKFQKVSNNSNAEVKALKKLGGVSAPKFISNNVIKANNNMISVIPRGIKAGNDVHILVSNMIRGNPLRKWYTGAPIPDDIKTKIRNAVKNMHSKGVIHGDLHANNILVANDGRVFVIDFGKALVTNRSFKTANNANNYLKKLTGRTKEAHGKISYYSNNKRTHFLNGNFFKRLK